MWRSENNALIETTKASLISAKNNTTQSGTKRQDTEAREDQRRRSKYALLVQKNTSNMNNVQHRDIRTRVQIDVKQDYLYRIIYERIHVFRFLFLSIVKSAVFLLHLLFYLLLEIVLILYVISVALKCLWPAFYLCPAL